LKVESYEFRIEAHLKAEPKVLPCF